MAWTLDGNVLYVQKLTEGTKQVIASLNPLAAGTVYQVFGYDTSKVKLSALVVGESNKDAIHALTTHVISVALSSPNPVHPHNPLSLGNYLVSAVNSSREPTIYQTIDTAQDCETPVFSLDIELFKEI